MEDKILRWVYKDKGFWTFTCPVCNNTLEQSKPFKLYYCPYCALDIMAYNEECDSIRYDPDVERRNLLENMKSRYLLTDEEKEAIDYATMLIQSKIDGEVE